MSLANAYEQYMLELVNAERARAGAQPLALDGDLNEAAENHSAWMIATDTFSHTGTGGSNPGARMTNGGYAFSGSWAWGENIAWMSTRAPAGLQNEVEQMHNNLMNSPGHRANILNPNFREIGIGLEVGQYGSYEGAFVTQDFARSGSNSFLTGVMMRDLDGDKRYDLGEGLGNFTVNARNNATGAIAMTATNPGGGYELELPSGSYTVVFSGSGFAKTTKQVSIGTVNVKLDLINLAASNITPSVSQVQTISGTSGPDVLSGTPAHDVISGLGGDDVLYGNRGNDRLYGGDGNDKLIGGLGADTMSGGAGNDQYFIDNLQDQIIEGPGGGTDLVYTIFDTYTLPGNLENLSTTTTGNRSWTGNELNNWIEGGNGADTLIGLGGNDRLNGLGGNDTLKGGAGADKLDGALGADRLEGGTGNDIFDFDSVSESGLTPGTRDIVVDFVVGQDKLDLSAIDAIAGSGDKAFSLSGANNFTGAGQLRWVNSGTNTIIEGNIDNDLSADFQIMLIGNHVLHLTDFVL
ncbi:MAG TPA: CAP domain-containing protein [Nitrosospira sp.]|nr:CAP domain-containing protein [Nitrosospira sp.]